MTLRSGGEDIKRCNKKFKTCFIMNTSYKSFYGVLKIHTINSAESWYNFLKSVYLNGIRKQKIDILVCRLLEEVLKNPRIKFALTQSGVCDGEQIWLSRGRNMRVISSSYEVTLSYVTLFQDSENSDIFAEKMSNVHFQKRMCFTQS